MIERNKVIYEIIKFLVVWFLTAFLTFVWRLKDKEGG